MTEYGQVTAEKIARIEVLEHRSNLIQGILIALLLLVISVPFVFYYIVLESTGIVSGLKMDNFHVEGKNSLCPGETLVVSYSARASGAGVIRRNATVARLPPDESPITLFFAEPVFPIIVNPVERDVFVAWEVPEEMIDFETGESNEIQVGNYRIMVALSSLQFSNEFAVGWADFTVRDDCLK